MLTALQGRQIPLLNGLRAIFALMVVAYHAGWPVPAHIGVTGFFVLSGFLITWLLLQERQQTSDISLRAFYARRAFRIFPAYYAFVGVSIALDLFAGDDRIRPAIVPALTYLTNYYNAFNGHPTSSVAHLWSLACEEQFYLLWPPLLLLVKRPARMLLGVIVAVAVWRSIAYTVLDLGPAYVYNAFDTRMDDLAAGCLLAFLVRSASTQDLIKRYSHPLLVALLAVAILVPQPDTLRYTVGMSLTGALMAAFLIQVLALAESPWIRWLDTRPMVYLGAISYGIYLYHQLGMTVAHHVAKGWWAVPVGVAITIAGAAASYHILEQPILKWGRRVVARQSTHPHQSTSAPLPSSSSAQ